MNKRMTKKKRQQLLQVGMNRIMRVALQKGEMAEELSELEDTDRAVLITVNSNEEFGIKTMNFTSGYEVYGFLECFLDLRDSWCYGGKEDEYV